jgi:hypothetical protein
VLLCVSPPERPYHRKKDLEGGSQSTKNSTTTSSNGLPSKFSVIYSIDEKLKSSCDIKEMFVIKNDGPSISVFCFVFIENFYHSPIFSFSIVLFFHMLSPFPFVRNIMFCYLIQDFEQELLLILVCVFLKKTYY